MFVTSSSASIAASAFPGAPYPAFDVFFDAGGTSLRIAASGPSIVRSGEAQRVEVAFPYEGESGELDVRVEIIPYYTHLQPGAAFQFALGPAHPMSLSASAAS